MCLLCEQGPGGGQPRNGAGGGKVGGAALGGAHLPAYPGFMQQASQPMAPSQQAKALLRRRSKSLPRWMSLPAMLQFWPFVGLRWYLCWKSPARALVI